MQVAKVTLSSGKIVQLRIMKISDTEKAAEQVAQRADGDTNLLQLYMQKALLKNLVMTVQEVGGEMKKLTANEKEDIDSVFTTGEYSQLLEVIGKMAGKEDSKKQATVEFSDTE